MAVTHPPLVILSGERGQGKTRMCQAVCELARQQGLSVQGVISPAVFTDGVKTGILVENAANGEQMPLAYLRQPGLEAEIQTDHWQFDPAAMAWGSRILEQADFCDVLIVDELGPLELVQHRGWVTGIKALQARQFRLGIVVIRPELLDAAQQILPGGVVQMVDTQKTYLQQAGELLKQYLKL